MSQANSRQEALVKKVREALTEHRFRHTLGVMETAKALAIRFGADPEKAALAGLVHDYAKFWKPEKMRRVILNYGLPSNLLDFDKELWHAPAGAIAIQTELGIEDTEVINAVRYHTSGRVGMTLLEKVVCLADYIEPNRDFPGVEEIRRLSEESLEQALVYAFGGTIQFLASKHKAIYPQTIFTYNDLLNRVSVTQN